MIVTETELKNIVKIAQKYIPGLAKRSDLEAQNNDALDFVDVSVWSLKAALIAACELGKSTNQACGHWIKRTDYTIRYVCSECGHQKEFKKPYCEHCGAKMMED